MVEMRMPNYWLASTFNHVGLIFGKYSYKKYTVRQSEIKTLESFKKYLENALEGHKYSSSNAGLHFNYMKLIELEALKEIKTGFNHTNIDQFLKDIYLIIDNIINNKKVNKEKLLDYRKDLSSYASSIINTSAFTEIDKL